MTKNWPLTAAPETVIAAIRAEMARYNVEQQDIANRLGMTQQAVSRRLTGQVLMTVDEITSFAGVIGCPAGRLLNPVK